MSIKHLESISINELEELLYNLGDYEATEKLDGAQLLFGIDNRGFYTSRETKGGTRIYDVSDYEIDYHTTFKRAAHIVLEQSLPKLVAAGMLPGDQVEVEVLHGEIPNVVPYSKDTSYIIFLRTTEGSVNINRLQQEFAGYSLPLTLSTPTTEDGLVTEFKPLDSVWEFSAVPVVHMHVDALNTKIKPSVDKLFSLLHSPSGVHDLTYMELMNFNLNKLGKVADRDVVKSLIKEARTDVKAVVLEQYVMPLKEFLLDHVVRNCGSKFGPINGWIEGVVLKHKATGKMVKLVDKEIFGAAHKFTWATRSALDDQRKEAELSRVELEALLDKYNRQKDTLILSLPAIGTDLSYTGAIHKRTLEHFAFLYRRAT